MWHKLQHCFSLYAFLGPEGACWQLQRHAMHWAAVSLLGRWWSWPGEPHRHVLASARPALLPHAPGLSLARRLLEMPSMNFWGLVLKQLSETIQTFLLWCRNPVPAWQECPLACLSHQDWALFSIPRHVFLIPQPLNFEFHLFCLKFVHKWRYQHR